MRLRDYRKEDSAIICRWLQNEEEFYRWSADKYNRYPLSDNDIDDYYCPQMEDGRFFPLTALDDEGHIIGHLIIRYLMEDDDSMVHFGFIVIKPECRGKGYGKEMVCLGIQYVKEKLHAKRIDLGVFENNDKAIRCYEQIGFKEFDRRRCELPVGVWVCIDMELFL